MTKRRRLLTLPVVIGLLSIGLGLYTSVPLVAGSDWNPSILIKFPEANPEQLGYGEEMLGDVVAAPGQGHDGKYYFMQAMDPFYVEPDQHARMLGRPSYRAQRMLYPTIASGFGLLSPWATAWSLWGLNLIALFVGGWLTARLALQMGLSAWFGVAFALNPGVLISSLIDTADVLAMVFFIAGVAMIMRRRYLAAGVAITFAALSRETMLLAALGAVLYLWRTERKVPPALGLPFAATAAWWVYLRLRIGHLDDGLQDTAAIGFPFRGFYEAIRLWLTHSGTSHHFLLGVVLMALAIFVLRHAVRRPTLLGYMSAGFSLIAFTMTVDVWTLYFDSARALVPMITAYALMVPAEVKMAQPISVRQVPASDRTGIWDVSVPPPVGSDDSGPRGL